MFTAAAVREDSQQHTAQHGKAWHQVQAPEWAKRINHRIRRTLRKNIITRCTRFNQTYIAPPSGSSGSSDDKYKKIREICEIR